MKKNGGNVVFLDASCGEVLVSIFANFCPEVGLHSQVVRNKSSIHCSADISGLRILGDSLDPEAHQSERHRRSQVETGSASPFSQPEVYVASARIAMTKWHW